jgi:uncharacterized protein (TIGR03435 family)
MRNWKSLIYLALAATAAGQTPEPTFDVASVKPAQPGRQQGVWTDGSPLRIRIQNLTLKELISHVYEVRGFQVFGPAWIENEKFDILAKLPDSAAKLTSLQRDKLAAAMGRSLLAERFQLQIHRENRDLPVFALVVAKGGLKIKKTGVGKGDLVRVDYRAGHLAGQEMPMRQLVSILSQLVRHPVIDETGFHGLTDIKLDWVPANPDGTVPSTLENKPPLENALHEQLGLKLEERKAPTEVIVVDRVEKLTEN